MLDAKHLAQAILWTVVSVSSKHILIVQILFVILTVGSGNYPVGIVPHKQSVSISERANEAHHTRLLVGKRFNQSDSC